MPASPRPSAFALSLALASLAHAGALLWLLAVRPTLASARQAPAPPGGEPLQVSIELLEPEALTGLPGALTGLPGALTGQPGALAPGPLPPGERGLMAMVIPDGSSVNPRSLRGRGAGARERSPHEDSAGANERSPGEDGAGVGEPGASAEGGVLPPGNDPSSPRRGPLRLTLTADEAARALSREGATGERPRGPASNGELARRIERRLQDAQDDHDRKAGLGPGGTVAQALADAGRSGKAPQEGRATFDVVAGPDGRVESVALASAPDDAAGWTEVGRVALAALKGRPLRVSRGAKGVRVRIALQAKLVYPSGRKQRLDVRLPLVRPEGKREEPPEKGEPITTRNRPAEKKPLDPYKWWESTPLPELPNLDKLPDLSIGIGFDPVDFIGGKTRVVETRILDEEPL